jgi:rRNA maturation RNase YbeY
LLNINKQYLKHNTYTDVVTFDNTTEKGVIVGDIFISIDRIKENSIAFSVAETNELHRVIIHGTLHLLGYKDKNKESKALMTQKEDQYLSARNFLL